MVSKKEGQKYEVWFDGRQLSLENQDTWGLINNSAINKVILTKNQRQEGNYPLKTEFITQVSAREDLEDINSAETVLSSDLDLLELAQKNGFKTCALFNIEGREALESAWQHAKDYDYILVDFDLPTNIPLELIIARLQNSKTIILKSVTTLSELEVA
ncbi:MAG: 3-dehydroquinate synthase II, partial [Bacillota bacterium]|nr:3-dehydroquinate synthase II [Bacillota bacterium]